MQESGLARVEETGIVGASGLGTEPQSNSQLQLVRLLRLLRPALGRRQHLHTRLHPKTPPPVVVPRIEIGGGHVDGGGKIVIPGQRALPVAASAGLPLNLHRPRFGMEEPVEATAGPGVSRGRLGQREARPVGGGERIGELGGLVVRVLTDEGIA